MMNELLKDRITLFRYLNDSPDCYVSTNREIFLVLPRNFNGKYYSWWMSTGKLWCDAKYRNGELNGMCVGYHSDGEIWDFQIYKNGKSILGWT